MKEWFIESNSFAAPVVSDHDFHYVEAATAVEALKRLVVIYKHPAGLYAANVYDSADAYHKGRDPLARWWCNQAIATKDATTVRSEGGGRVEINGKMTIIDKPKEGRIIA